MTNQIVRWFLVCSCIMAFASCDNTTAGPSLTSPPASPPAAPPSFVGTWRISADINGGSITFNSDGTYDNYWDNAVYGQPPIVRGHGYWATFGGQALSLTIFRLWDSSSIADNYATSWDYTYDSISNTFTLLPNYGTYYPGPLQGAWRTTVSYGGDNSCADTLVLYGNNTSNWQLTPMTWSNTIASSTQQVLLTQTGTYTQNQSSGTAGTSSMSGTNSGLPSTMYNSYSLSNNVAGSNGPPYYATMYLTWNGTPMTFTRLSGYIQELFIYNTPGKGVLPKDQGP